jgi:hypothetical protein
MARYRGSLPWVGNPGLSDLNPFRIRKDFGVENSYTNYILALGLAPCWFIPFTMRSISGMA